MTQQVPDKINVFWFLPTHGDGRYLGTTEGGRPVDLPYLQQVALAADSLGYYGVLIPTGKSCEDSWLVASALAPLTRRLRYLVAVRPGSFCLWCRRCCRGRRFRSGGRFEPPRPFRAWRPGGINDAGDKN